MRVMIAGIWRSEIHEQTLSHGLESAGCSVIKFGWNKYFNSEANLFLKILRRIEYKYIFGYSVFKVNKDLVYEASSEKIDVLFLYRPNIISKNTLEKLKSQNKNLLIIGYNNDNPFSQKYFKYVWRVFLKAIGTYDIVFSYRPSNINAYKNAGAKNVYLLPPWFDPRLNFPVKLSEKEKIRYDCDIVFIGHYENDGRVDLIKFLLLNGVKVNIYGPGWNAIVKKDPLLNKFFPVRFIDMKEYNKVLAGSKMALVLLSTLNEDVYTRRCFEIPATKTMMVCIRTPEMEMLFQEDIEAVYFATKEELLNKVKFYIKNSSERTLIARNGYKRAMDSGYSVDSRAMELVKLINSYK